MTILHAVILSIIEGLTEFLPISSTGHLILASKLLKIPGSDFLTSFEIFIQLGAILAIVVLYVPKVIKNLHLRKALFLAFLPTAIIGFTLYPFIKQYLLNNETVTLWALFLGGIALILIETYFKSDPKRSLKLQAKSFSPTIDPGCSLPRTSIRGRDDVHRNSYFLPPTSYLLIGLCQSLSIIPGVSRAAATILGGLAVGLNRTQAVEFSFLLAIPTMAAATGLDLLQSGFNFTPNEWLLLIIGFLTAFVTALLAVRWFLKFIQYHSFVPFGIYRILLALIFLPWL